MPAPRIFISHSAHEPEARQLLEDLAAGLEQSGFVVLLDRARLAPGSRWRAEIYTWMGLCHAAVVLLSPSALRAESWVSTEVTILGWRMALDPRMLLIPVLVPPVTRRKLKRGALGRIAINEIQAAPNDPEALVAELTRRFESLLQVCPTTTLEPWVRIIAEAVADAERRNPRMIEEAAAAVGRQLPVWEPGVAAREQLAREMLGWEPAAIRMAVEYLCCSIEDDPLERMIQILGCLWVDPQAVARIPEVASGPEPGRVIALNATNAWTAKMYVKRAACSIPSWAVLPAPNQSGEDQATRISKEIRQAMVDRFGLEGYTPKQINSWLRDKWARPVVVLLDAEGLDQEIVAEVRREWPAPVLLLLTGDRAVAPELGAEGQAPLLTLPDLDRVVEQDAWDNYLVLRNLIKKDIC
jgi:hypothetical protein